VPAVLAAGTIYFQERTELHMLKKTSLILFAISGLCAAAPEPAPAAAPQPVFIVLYSRFYDHSSQHTTDERLQRLLPLLDRLHKQYPESGISALFQFSGTVSQLLDEENAGLHLVDQLKEYSRRNLVDIGYTGEEEPSYLYRPKPNLLLADTPEERWAAKADAAERFLTDYKNPVTGLPVPGLSGGLKRAQEVFGNVAFITGATTTLGGDSPSKHEIRKMAPSALMGGIPGADPRRGIEGFAISADNFSRWMSPDPVESPEVFWQDNLLHLSDTSLNDIKPHSTDEGPEALKKVFEKLDRSHVRVIKLEVASYRRYLTRRADGSIVADPLEWLYYHPDDPIIPVNMHSRVTQTEVEAGNRRDEATLKWLLEEFLPANPGSRFISVRELAQLPAPNDSEVDAGQLKALATDLNEQFVQSPMRAPDFGRAGSRFFTLAESFGLFAQALSGLDKTGSLPKSVLLTPMYGPLTLPNDMGPTTGSVPVSAVIQAAAQIAPRLADTEWKPVPANAVPATVATGSLRLNAAQFLRLMAQAYLDPSPGKTLYVNAVTLTSRSSFMFPKNTAMTDQGNSWTFKPAPLRVGTKEPSGTFAATLGPH
jgi:hypothetical protein